MNLKDLLNILLSKTNISKLNICQDKIEVYLDGPITFTEEPKHEPAKAPGRKYTLSKEGAFNKVKVRVKDTRWIRIMNELHITPKEWLAKEYPDVGIADMHRTIGRHPDWSVRQCAEYCQE